MFKEIYVKIILIFLLMVNVLTSPRRIERLTWLLVLASGYIAFRAVLDYVRGIISSSTAVSRVPFGGIFKNPNDLALNMVALLPFAVFIALRPGSMAAAGDGRPVRGTDAWRNRGVALAQRDAGSRRDVGRAGASS